MDDQWGAVKWQDIVLEAIKRYGFLNRCFRFFRIPGRGMDEPVDGAFSGCVPQPFGEFSLQLPNLTNCLDIVLGSQPLVEIF